MSLPAYAEHKDSGLEWLGEVPSHWQCTPLKRLGTIRYGIGEPPPYREEGVPLIRATNIHEGFISQEGLVFVDPSDIPSQRIVWLRSGDCIVVRSGAYTGDSALVTDGYEGAIAGFDMVFRPKHCVPSFVKYGLLSRYVKDFQLDLKKSRAAQPHLNAEELGECLFVLPHEAEQTAIAAFLDRETAKIDGLIAEQEKLLALLAEKRQATISHAVTKGLNADAPMKDSGVAWLGKVPAHWAIRKTSTLFRAKKGANAAQLTKEYCATIEGEYPVYSGQTENEGIMASINEFEFDAGESGYLFSTTVGARAMSVMLIKGRFSLSQNCMVITPVVQALSLRFYYYHLQPLFSFERSMIPDHMQPSFRMEDLYSYRVASPPEKEQHEIAAFLDSEIARIDALTTESTRAIDLLKERRSALISAAVTGKIDVRGVMQSKLAHSAEMML